MSLHSSSSTMFKKYDPEEEKNAELKLPPNTIMTRNFTVFSEDTLKQSFDKQANEYQNQFISAGFPPKICSELVDSLCKDNKYKCQVLDVGCGNGFVGQYLKELGFQRISGIDCRQTKLQTAQSKKCYQSIERLVFGLEDSVVPEKYIGKFDFVTCASLVNNSDLSIKIFYDLLSTVKIGGFVIFASKLDKLNNNEYEKFMTKLTEEEHWAFTTDHQFYRYDKLFGDLGKFSNKLVKVFVYQKRDHQVWVDRMAKEEEERQKELARRRAILEDNDNKKKKAQEDKENITKKKKKPASKDNEKKE